MAANPNSSISQTKPTTPVYSDYEFTQLRDTLVPLLLACPARLIPSINHDIRQLFAHSGDRLFGDKRKGWRIEDYAEFVFFVKTGRYEPEDPLFVDMPRMALTWRGRDGERCESGQYTSISTLVEQTLDDDNRVQNVRRAFEAEFMRWVALTDKAPDYGLERPE